jgi:hypothetical protein
MNIKHIISLILFSIIIKISYFSIPVITNENINANYFNQYINIVKKNDSYWYEKISLNGYSKIKNKRDLGYSEGAKFKQSEWAFFPLYPAINILNEKIFHLNFDTSSLLLSILFSILSIIGIYWFGLIFLKNQSLAFFNALLIFCLPFSFYYSMFYTEALYFTFMIFSFISIHYKKYILLSLLLIPLTLVRANGIIIIIPLYLYFLERTNLLLNIKSNWKQLFSAKNLIPSIAFLTAPISFFLYCIYQYKMTGFYNAFSIAQDGWYREFTLPFMSFFRRGDLSTQFNSIYTILVILYAFYIRKKLPLSLNILIVLSILLPLCSGSVMSMTRFISVIFPLFLVLSSMIYKIKFNYLILFIILFLHFFSFYGWVIYHPITY